MYKEIFWIPLSSVTLHWKVTFPSVSVDASAGEERVVEGAAANTKNIKIIQNKNKNIFITLFIIIMGEFDIKTYCFLPTQAHKVL